MKIARVFAKDFLSYAHLDLPLADLGLCLVEGENQDTGGSNGSGKSSIFEAIVWCLFGKTTKNVSADEVLRQDALGNPVKGDTCVCVTLDDQGTKYEIYRHRKHRQHGNKVLVFINGKEKTSSTDQATQKIINQILRLDYKAFVSSVMYPQKAENFVEMTDTERKSVFSKLIGTERFAEAQERAKEQVKKIELAKATLINRQSTIVGGMDQCYNMIRDMDEKIRIWEAEKVKQILLKEEQMDQLTGQKLPSIDPAWQIRIEELAEITKNGVKPYQDRLNQIHADDTKLLTSRANLQQRVNYIDTLPNEFSEADMAMPSKSSEELQRDAAQWSQAKVRVDMELGQVTEDIERLKFELVQAGEYTHCDKCGQELPEEARDKVFVELGKRTDSLVLRRDDLEQKQKQYTESLLTVQAAYEQALRYNHYVETMKLKAERPPLVADIETIDLKLAAAAQEREQVTSLCNQVVGAFQESEKLKGQIASVERAIVDMRHRIDKIADDIKVLRESQNPYPADKVKLEESVAKLEAEYAEVAQKIDQDGIILKKYRFWVDGFGKNGVESLLFDHAIPALNEKANLYLQELTDGQAFIWFDTKKTLSSGETREAFDTRVSFAGAGQNYKQVSGGEAQRVNIATTLALGDLCAERSNAPISLRLLDEPFEGLDTVGAEQVVKLLHNRVADKASTVLIMTHDENLKSLVSNRIKVTKRGGVSVCQ